MKNYHFILFFILVFLPFNSSSQNWEGVGGGTDPAGHSVFSIYEFNNVIHISGWFGSVAGGTLISEGYATWNGVNWMSGNTTFLAGTGRAFTTYNGDLYIGGDFQRINGNKYCQKIAHLDSLGWSPLGSGITSGSIVNCMAVYNGDLYVGGQFTEVDSTIVANRIARWDGSNWNAMGTGFSGGFGNVNDMAIFQNELYVGGFFNNIDGLAAPGICKWNGFNWDTLSNGLNGPALSLYADSTNNRLYVGGQFTMAGGVNTPTGVAFWNGSNWFPVGLSPYIPARDLIVYDGKLYNASTQSHAINLFGDTIKYLAWFDGVNWIPVPGGVDATAHCFKEYQNELYVGGVFVYAGDSLVYGIAKWIPGSLGTPESANHQSAINFTPNPASDEVLIEMNLKKPTELDIRISDSNGKLLKTDSLSGIGKVNHQINISQFSSGTYIFSVFVGSVFLESQKVVIAR